MKTLTIEQKAQVEGLSSLLSQDQLADYFGVGRSTFQEMLKRDPEISGLYARGRSKAFASVAQGLLQRARDGDTQSAIFYLKSQAKWRDTQAVELSGPDKGAIQHQMLDPSKLSTAALAEVLGAFTDESPATEPSGQDGD